MANTVSPAFACLNFLVFLHRIIPRSDKLDVVAERLTILTRTAVVPSSNFGPPLTDVSYIAFLDCWLTVHRSITLFNLQLDAQILIYLRIIYLLKSIILINVLYVNKLVKLSV